ncbi:hypothetical protein [Mesorhizobium sp. M7A.F.Ca.US.011.01.1.1]|uniref:hypothetical protein n=1 Tax=Mesorhizobium sp. M7A.F.Ca.US.011.01.1.1 TaxID=2496741 RepID=UPI0013E383CC|nr:hypothetical protein [Mesorhizobium sp. M7A.F.Ca.US.011.01.1.1]
MTIVELAFDLLAKKLAARTGISSEEASDLVANMGADWSSLVRAARVMKKYSGVA